MKRVEINGQSILHNYAFDPTGGFEIEALLEIQAPPAPDDFEAHWKRRYEYARTVNPCAQISPTGEETEHWRVMDLSFRSTNGYMLGGWALVPKSGAVRRGFVVGHGYGGIDGPIFDLPFHDAVILFPCFRGISRSQHPDLPSEPNQHVVHGIENPDTYLIGACVEDVWVSVSALLELFPEVAGNVGFLGISFSGGLMMLAAPWDERVQKIHCNVPTFGHQALRLQLPSAGSAEGVRQYEKTHPRVALKSLTLHDAAIAARHLKIPAHLACALFDPVVAPVGQFAIYNALPEANRDLFILSAGHHPYHGEGAENTDLMRKIDAFFADSSQPQEIL